MSSYARREIGKQVYAWMILLSHLDGTAGLPKYSSAPQKRGESAEDYAARVKAERLMEEVQATVGRPAEQVAEVLSSWVPRSLVSGVVNNLAAEGLRHLKAATPDSGEWQAGARPFLRVLCPPKHLEAALGPLEALVASRLEIDDVVAEYLTDRPVATVHAAAALVAWLYWRPDIIADPAAARHDLAQRADKFGALIF